MTSSATTLDATRDHYRKLLSPIYRWMLGDFDAAVARSRMELEALGIGRARGGARGLDLGAGPGLHAIPMAELGYRVTAVDLSEELLAELAVARPDIGVVVANILEFGAYSPGPYDVVVCMGDTLTHLPSLDDVDRLFEHVLGSLAPKGTFALTFRDYATSTRESTDRFILVRADDARILTCCLDYGPDRVRVTDVVHERTQRGWEMRAGAYPKLRLSLDWVVSRLSARGAEVTQATTAMGRITVAVRARP